MRLRSHDHLRHVIWDWNGTLLDDAWLCVEVMNGLLRERGLPLLDAARYQALFGFPVHDYYRRLGFDFEREPFERVGTEFIDGYQARQHECRLQSGAAEALRRFADRGATMSVLSASEQVRLEAQARHLGVRGLFTQLLGLDDHYAGSKLDLGRRWVADVDIDPREILMIGDTDHDAEVARALGIECALVPSGHQTEARLRALGVPVAATLADLAPREAPSLG